MADGSRGVRAAAWIGGALALALALFIASLALRPTPEGPSPTETAVAVEPVPAEEVAPAQDAARGVPSGQPVRFHEAIFEQQNGGTTWLRLRFVAPEIGAPENPVEFEVASTDMEFLCQQVGIPVAARSGREVELIVISLSAQETVFGEIQPDVIQFFDAWRPENGDCIWEEFW